MSELRQRSPRVEDPKYLKLIRKMPCIRCGANPCGEAAHLRLTGDGKLNPGMGAKPDDAWALPLCHQCHVSGPGSQHSMGEATFWRDLGHDPIRIARNLYRMKDNEDAMRAYVFGHLDNSLWI